MDHCSESAFVMENFENFRISGLPDKISHIMLFRCLLLFVCLYDSYIFSQSRITRTCPENFWIFSIPLSDIEQCSQQNFHISPVMFSSDDINDSPQKCYPGGIRGDPQPGTAELPRESVKIHSNVHWRASSLSHCR
jgi:hypothetical protein